MLFPSVLDGLEQPRRAVEKMVRWKNCFCMLNQSGGFVPALCEVEALDGLSAGALHEVVDSTHDNQAAGAAIEAPREVEIVAVRDVLGIRQCAGRQKTDEKLIIISASIAGSDLLREIGFFSFCHKRLRRGQIECAQDSASDRCKVRGELHRYGSSSGRRKLLFHLGQVPMLGDSIWL